MPYHIKSKHSDDTAITMAIASSKFYQNVFATSLSSQIVECLRFSGTKLKVSI